MARATDFEDWVFRRNNPWWRDAVHGARSAGSREFGAFAHDLIERRCLWIAKLSEPPSGAWGIEYPPVQGEERRTFHASDLIVQGKPLACRPDVVLREAQTARRLIIERKTHVVRGPRGWNRTDFPNVWAQLWCYAHIDEWWPRRDTILISEMWNFNSRGVKPRCRGRTFRDVDSEIRPLFEEWVRSRQP